MSHPPAGVPRTSCPHCGAPVSSPFCTSCGRAVEISAPAPTLTRTPTPAPLFAPAPVTRQPYVEAPRVQASSVAAAPPAAGGRGGRTLLVRAVVAFVVLIATGIGGVFGYQWWRDRPATQALEAADAAVSAVTDPLAKATTLDDVSAAAVGCAGSREEGRRCPRRPLRRRHHPHRARAARPAEPAGLPGVGGALRGPERGVPHRVGHPAFPQCRSHWPGWRPRVDPSAPSTTERPERSATPRPRSTTRSTWSAPLPAESLALQLDELLADIEKVTHHPRGRSPRRTGRPAGRRRRSGRGRAGGRRPGVARLARRRPRGDRRARQHGSRDAPRLDRGSYATQRGHRRARSVLGCRRLDERVGLAGPGEDGRVAGGVRPRLSRRDPRRPASSTPMRPLVRRTLRQYDRARDATSDALEEADMDFGSSYTVEYAMEEGVLTRRDLLDDLESLSVPGALVTVHGGLESGARLGRRGHAHGGAGRRGLEPLLLRLRGDLPRHEWLAVLLHPLRRDHRRVRPRAQGVERGAQPGA